MMCNYISGAYVVCLCMYINPNTQTHTPTQNHLYSIHSQKQGFITAAWLQHLAGQPLASAPVWHFFVFATEWFVCVRLVWETRCVKGLLLPGFCVFLRQCYECLMMAHIVPSQCACACLVCLAGGICVVLFVLKVFPRSNPEAALAEGDTHTHRERKRESVPLLSPSHPDTNPYSTIWNLNAFLLLTSCFQLLSALFFQIDLWDKSPCESQCR